MYTNIFSKKLSLNWDDHLRYAKNLDIKCHDEAIEIVEIMLKYIEGRNETGLRALVDALPDIPLKEFETQILSEELPRKINILWMNRSKILLMKGINTKDEYNHRLVALAFGLAIEYNIVPNNVENLFTLLIDGFDPRTEDLRPWCN